MWRSIYAGLLQEAGSLRAVAAFAQLRAAYLALAAFASPSTLLAFLQDRGAPAGAKGEIYLALVRAARGRSSVAAALLGLGLWPALSRTYYLLCASGVAADDAAACVWDLFTGEVYESDLTRCRKLYGTFARNIRRDAIDWLQRGRRELRRREQSAAEILAETFAPLPGPDAVEREPEPLTAEALAIRIREILGARPYDHECAEIVLGKAFGGMRVEDVGARFGLRRAAAIARWQRSLRKLRPYFGHPATRRAA